MSEVSRRNLFGVAAGAAIAAPAALAVQPPTTDGISILRRYQEAQRAYSLAKSRMVEMWRQSHARMIVPENTNWTEAELAQVSYGSIVFDDIGDPHFIRHDDDAKS